MYQPFYQQPSVLSGKIINRPEDIFVNDVAMDGSISVFPKSDLSEILVKRWNSNGVISTLKFVPFTEGVANSTLKVNDEQIALLNATNKGDFNEIKEAIFRIEKLLGGKRNVKPTTDPADNE